jgi:lysyl-tRNA synthetase class 2
MADWQAGTDLDMLQMRARMLSDIRAFFAERDVLEVETPVLSRYATTDLHLDSMQCHVGGRRYFLNTSPEYAMKRLLAQHRAPIYQVSRAFRDDEIGQYHNPEFSLLEWYRPGFDDVMLMAEVEVLVRRLYRRDDRPQAISIQRISYHDAFLKVLGVDPHEITAYECHSLAIERGIDIPEGMGKSESDRDAWLDWFLTQAVMPSVSAGHAFTLLCDYPVSQAALAAIAPDETGRMVAKRFELFFGELELANGFLELTDADEQRRRFDRDNRLRQAAGKQAMPVDEYLLDALAHGMPSSAGVALGLDRLLMVLSDSASIDKVIGFTVDNA